MPKPKGNYKDHVMGESVLTMDLTASFVQEMRPLSSQNHFLIVGKGGKNRRRGKGDGEESKRELEFKEDGESYVLCLCFGVSG